MARRSTLSVIKSAALPAIALFIIADFAAFAIFGPNGLLSLAGYHSQKIDKTSTLERLRAERNRLQHHADLLDPRHVDPDYADEIVRHETGQIRPSEVIIPRN